MRDEQPLPAGRPPGVRRLHHVALLTRAIDDAIAHYSRWLGVDPPIVRTVDRPGIRLRTAMVPTGPGADTFIQLIEPAEGPGVAELAAGGEGTIFELAFEVDDIGTTVAAFRTDGVVPIDLLGGPVEGPYLVAASGMRYVYLPVDATRGTRTEIVQPVPPEDRP